MTIAAAAIAAGAVLPPAGASADMILSEVILQLSPEEIFKEIVVTNTGPETLFVSAELSEIVDAGLPTQERVEHRDPEVAGMIVTPTRVVVQPGQRRTLRIAFTGDRPQRDRIYRLLVKPVVGDIDATETMLQILIAYDVLIVVEPEDPAFELDWQRNGHRLTLTNTGNTNALLQNGLQCPPAGECVEVSGRRVYPGATIEIELPSADGEATFMVSGAGQHQKASF